MSTAPAPTDRAEKVERVAKAACDWVYDQSCSGALAELEDAVVDLVGAPIEGDRLLQIDFVPATHPTQEP